MELVAAVGRRRGPPLERLAAHWAVVHLFKGFWVTGQGHADNLTGTTHFLQGGVYSTKCRKGSIIVE
jgi:hypothetical protein